MKKLSTIGLILFSVLVFSQEKEAAKGLEVYNKTKCTQFFVVEWVNNCQCNFSLGINGTSNIIKIAPEKSVFINDQEGNNIIPKNMFITAAKVGGGYYCTGSSAVGQPCSKHPTTYLFVEYVKYNEECKECTNTLATWIPGDCGNPAILVFTEP